MKTRLKLLLPLLLAALASCESIERDATPADGEGTDLSTVMVNPLKPYFADLTADAGTAQTKAGIQLVSLESIINRLQVKTATHDGVTLTQIAFKDQYNGPAAYFGADPAGDPDKAVATKKFLIMHRTGMFVATMVTDADYATSHPGFDYLDKPDYTGAVIFSTITGTLIRTSQYVSGLVLDAKVTDPREVRDTDYLVRYILSYGPATKSAWYEKIDAAVITEKRPEPKEPNPFFGYHGTGDDSGGGNDDGYHWGGGGGQSNQGNGSGSGNKNEDSTRDRKFEVKVGVDMPDRYSISGSGEYTEGSTVTVSISPKRPIYNLNVKYWTGYFAGYKTSTVTAKVTCKIESTAYLSDDAPCHSAASGKMNPLSDMSIAASGKYDNYWGGTFGKTRMDGETGRSKQHDGLDLYAREGTPVYATYEGTITTIESSHPNQYENNSFGNQIQITVQNGNSSFIVQYAHLRAGNPIAYNYREGRPFKENDKVYPGDLIGYTGRTGNAYYVENPHLHFGIMVAGKWVDPKNYINGSYATGQSAINNDKGKIKNIRCD